MINRGNARARVFHDETDYRGFVKLLSAANERLPMRLLAYCLMPNHFHLVLWPLHDGDLGRWMQWLLTSHVRRHHCRHGTEGHVWQGRYKGFPIEPGDHLMTVLRYVERNALRANLVARAEDWPWCSLALLSSAARGEILHPGPMPRPEDWYERVNQPASEAELAALRRSVNRGTPWGSAPWVARTAAAFGLESTLRPRGRPRKPSTAQDQKRGQATFSEK